MAPTDRNDAILSLGRDFFAAISGDTPSLFNKDWWTGKVMDWAMDNDHFKTQLFHFVDVLPTLTTDESLLRHIEEYFGGDQEVPAVLRWGAKHAGIGGKLTAKILAHTLQKNIEAMARQFIIGQDLSESMTTLHSLRSQGFAGTVDILGEASVSEKEAEACQQHYLALLDRLAAESATWQPLGHGAAPGTDWLEAPQINISVKPTSLYSQAHPADWENSVSALCNRFIPLLRKAKEIKAFINIDMEQHLYKNLTLEVYRRLRSSEEFRDFPYFGIVMQTYLRETDADLEQMLAWARKEKLPITIRLVKGAYWDYETIIARQKGQTIPVYQMKAESDAAFERCALMVLQNHDICSLACASHNIRTIAAVLAAARELAVPEERYEFQVLYGMAGPVRRALLKISKRVRLYCPYGELLPGMGYLVRRLLENTANESFLRQSFVEQRKIEQLLADPALLAVQSVPEDTHPKESAAFRNEPFPDFTKSALRTAFHDALAAIKKKCGSTYPLIINGREIRTAEKADSVNPANPEQVIGRVHQAGVDEIDLALRAAKESAAHWQQTSAEERASYLFKAAAHMRARLLELACWQVLEVGKQWEQAYMDVAEAIDFLEYYGRQIIRLTNDRKINNPPGEDNIYHYRPKGITAVIAPWNFPLAISCGMCAAALAAGNCVLYKPSGLATVTGFLLADTFRAIGLPKGVFHFVPGRGSVIGDYLVTHHLVQMIAFTGSAEVGLGIVEKTAQLHREQNHVKKVIAEMGGKNAIIIDDDADLDQAVPQVLASAFSYQGQKCSACSRVIVVDSLYDKFTDRLAAAARSLAIGPAEDPAFFMGPVIDRSAQEKILQYVALARKEGKVLVCLDVPDTGYYVPLTIVADVPPSHRLAQEEIFGPLLSIIRAKDFSEALSIANSTRYALTGGVFSRSPSHLAQARRDFQVGNLYLNRGITGALVHRQPFGGFRLSGVGSKAGGPDYLLQFMDPVVITENTMRRGFAPMDDAPANS